MSPTAATVIGAFVGEIGLFCALSDEGSDSADVLQAAPSKPKSATRQTFPFRDNVLAMVF